MTDRDWLYLPPDFGESGDPVKGNPFPPGTTPHQIWADATEIAERELLDLQLLLADPSRTPARTPTDFQGLVDWFVLPHAAKFDIWAKRGAYAVWSDATLKNYETWVWSYANSWLEALARFFEGHPAPFQSDPLLIEFRNILARRVLHWRSEGRRFLSEQLEFRRIHEAPPAVTPALIAKRKRLVAAYRNKHRLSAEGLAKRIGISSTGIRGLIREHRDRFSEDTQLNFLERLNISKQDWYSS